MLHRSINRTLIQANLGKRQIFIIEQNQVGAFLAYSLGNLGQFAVNIQLDAVGASQLSVCQIVETDNCAMRAQRLITGSIGLVDTQRSNITLGIIGDLDRKRVYPGGFKPLGTPCAYITAGSLFQLGQQVVKNSVTPSVLVKILLQSRHEVFLANPRNHLPQHRCALRVGNAVKVHLNIMKVTNLSHNWVG